MPTILQEQYSELHKDIRNIKNIEKPIHKAIIQVLKDTQKERKEEIHESIQLKLVFHCPESIVFFKQPTDKVLKMAFSKNAKLAFNFEELSIEIQRIMLAKDIRLVQYIKHLNENIQLELVQKDAYLVYYINNPILSIQEYCINNNIALFISINDPHPSIVTKFIESELFLDNQERFIGEIMSEYSKKLSATAIQIMYKATSSECRKKIKNHPNYKSLASYVLDIIDEINT
jgi:hypothetical protein